MLRLQRMLTRRGFLWILAALSILPAALAFGAPGAAAQETPRKSAKPEPPNDEYLRKVIKWNPWFLAAASGDTKTIQDYLTSGTQVNARDTFGRTALYVATAYEHADIVRLLLKAGADPNLPSEDPTWVRTQTALETTQKSGNKEVESALAQAGASMTAPPSLPRKHEEDYPPLYQAIADDSTATLRALLEKGSFLREDTVGAEMDLPHFALNTRRADCFSILLEKGLGPSGAQEERNALLKAAVYHYRATDTQRLLHAGASINTLPEYHLRRVVEKRDKELLWILLDSDMKLTNGVILSAVGTGDVEMVKTLSERSVNFSREAGYTALRIAAVHGNKKMVEYLLEKGVNPKPSGEKGPSLVEAVLRERHEDMADFLVQKGAEPVSEERRNQILHRRLEYTVTTETLASSEALSTGSLANAIDLGRYTLYQVTRKENTPDYPDIQKDRFLVFAESPDRIPVGSADRGLYFMDIQNISTDGDPPRYSWALVLGDDSKTSHEWLKLSWLEPGKIASVQWRTLYSGSGAITDEWTSILLTKGQRVTPIFTWMVNTYGRSGVSYWDTRDQVYSWDSRHRILTIRQTWQSFSGWDPERIRRLVVPEPLNSGMEHDHPRGTETTWRYRLEGEKFHYVGGQKVEKVAGGFPVLDVAEEYGVTIRRLVELNPELKGKVFCAGPVVVSTSISPIDKDR